MITIISSTNRSQAISKTVSIYYQKLLTEKGVESKVLDLTNLPDDFAFTALYENSGKNAAFNHYRDEMLNSEKFVFIVPEYNGSFPGILKTFIDGLSFPNTFTNKVCALIGISAGVQGSVLAMSHLTDIFNYCGMSVCPIKPKLSKIDDNFSQGVFTNPLYKELLDQQVDQLIKF